MCTRRESARPGHNANMRTYLQQSPHFEPLQVKPVLPPQVASVDIFNAGVANAAGDDDVETTRLPPLLLNEVDCDKEVLQSIVLLLEAADDDRKVPKDDKVDETLGVDMIWTDVEVDKAPVYVEETLDEASTVEETMAAVDVEGVNKASDPDETIADEETEMLDPILDVDVEPATAGSSDEEADMDMLEELMLDAPTEVFKSAAADVVLVALSTERLIGVIVIIVLLGELATAGAGTLVVLSRDRVLGERTIDVLLSTLR